MSQTLPSGTRSPDLTPVNRLRDLVGQISEALHAVNIPLLDDADAIDTMMSLEKAGRAIDAGRVASTTDIGQRAERGADETLAHKLGCTDKLDLITAVTLVSFAEARRRMSLGGADQRPARAVPGR